MVLGTLQSSGPLHGHEIRRIAEVTSVSSWGGVSVGALYRELRTMDETGHVESVRTEQVGRRPARTVYRITALGEAELRGLREEAVTEIHHGTDPFGVALLFTRTDDLPTLLGLLKRRRDAIRAMRDGIAAEGEALHSAGTIGPLDAAMFRRRVIQLDAELAWQDDLDRVIEQAVADSSGARPTAGAEESGAADPAAAADRADESHQAYETDDPTTEVHT
ncbi:PadR family transcriptional regulator [Kitasatospora sp. A2-31]|uniref:PadR family transcriptional regulator n=1 Tax=Kitasatospora sp. A2-31 TaxID=2916414 RepID=UPI001EEC70E7|nr:PadR family transcriptional regulator [Kitasatospora sp. A2-31]MCG6495594.1 PadR family transcriptional regulator [Kitasatospora sp. A2-31]